MPDFAPDFARNDGRLMLRESGVHGIWDGQPARAPMQPLQTQAGPLYSTIWLLGEERCKIQQFILTSTAIKARKEKKKRNPGKAPVDISLCCSTPRGSWRRNTQPWTPAQQVSAAAHTHFRRCLSYFNHMANENYSFFHSFCILANSLALCCAKQFYGWTMAAWPCCIPAAQLPP